VERLRHDQHRKNTGINRKTIMWGWVLGGAKTVKKKKNQREKPAERSKGKARRRTSTARGLTSSKKVQNPAKNPNQ